MGEASCPYEEGDEDRLEAILREWEMSPEPGKGDGFGAELIRVIRKISQVKERLCEIEAEIPEIIMSKGGRYCFDPINQLCQSHLLMIHFISRDRHRGQNRNDCNNH
jgi:hypothetical protein